MYQTFIDQVSSGKIGRLLARSFSTRSSISSRTSAWPETPVVYAMSPKTSPSFPLPELSDVSPSKLQRCTSVAPAAGPASTAIEHAIASTAPKKRGLGSLDRIPKETCSVQLAIVEPLSSKPTKHSRIQRVLGRTSMAPSRHTITVAISTVNDPCFGLAAGIFYTAMCTITPNSQRLHKTTHRCAEFVRRPSEAVDFSGAVFALRVTGKTRPRRACVRTVRSPQIDLIHSFGLHRVPPAQRVGIGQVARAVGRRPAWIRVPNWK